MAVYELTPEVSLEFCKISGKNYKPILLKDGDFITLPLVVLDEEIEAVITRLKDVRFAGHPVHYIKNIVAGCIAIVLKQPTIITF